MFLTQGTKSGFFQKPLVRFHKYIWLEEIDVAFGDCQSFHTLKPFTSPFLWGRAKDWNDRVITTAPHARTTSHYSADRTHISGTY
jgi:hypothetical protein